MDLPAISVIVPTFNGRHLLADLLPSLAAQTERGFETIVVDNGSQDGTAEFLAGRTDVRAILLDRNTGFTGAVNRGVAAATADLVLLLNNDMTPRPDFLAQLLAAAAAQPAAGSFACRVLQRDRPELIDSAGDRLTASGRSYGIGRGAVDGREHGVSGWVFGGTGGAVLYRRSLYLELGGLDDDFFLYVEDTDLALRAQLYGQPCWYVAAAITLHAGSATLTGREDVRSRFCLRNHLLFLLKSFPLRLQLAHLPEVLAGVVREARFAFTATRVRHGGARALYAVARTLAEVVALSPSMLWKRVRMRRRVPVATIARLLAPVAP